MSNESIIHKPLKGKYDKRKGNGASIETLALARVSRMGAGRSYQFLRKIDKYLSPVDLFIRAIENKQLALAWEIRSTLDERCYGKPFTATNPNDTRPKQQLDPKIAIAIQNLIPGAANDKPVSRAKARVTSQVIENEQHADVDVT